MSETNAPAGCGLRLWVEDRTPVKELPGFRPNHSVPKEVTSQTRLYVAGIGEAGVAADLERVAKLLREAFGLKRKELKSLGPDRGGGSLVCPQLTYTVTVSQADDDPALARTRREVEPSEPDVLTDPGLAFAFAPGFTALERRFDEPADVEAFIDAVEDADPPEVKGLDYPLDASECELRLAGFGGRVKITADAAAILAPTPVPPGDLVKAWAKVKGLLDVAGTG
ncbi:hypothetical protein [Alienimonas sp. DA493]|uniref:hypothetical protein n=1 Tax=Alienimonas sp. DA493 TaxID=3373605 RepID=UPI003754D4CA